MQKTALNLIRWLRRKDVRLGLVVGCAGLIFSWAASVVIPGRLLGNPMPIVLALSSLGRAIGSGFLYFSWQEPALHLGFATALAAVSAAAAAKIDLRSETSGRIAPRVARIALGLNVLASAWREIDSLTVALFYAGGGYLSVIAVGLIAGWMSGWLAPSGGDQLTR